MLYSTAGQLKRASGRILLSPGEVGAPQPWLPLLVRVVSLLTSSPFTYL